MVVANVDMYVCAVNRQCDDWSMRQQLYNLKARCKSLFTTPAGHRGHGEQFCGQECAPGGFTSMPHTLSAKLRMATPSGNVSGAGQCLMSSAGPNARPLLRMLDMTERF